MRLDNLPKVTGSKWQHQGLHPHPQTILRFRLKHSSAQSRWFSSLCHQEPRGVGVVYLISCRKERRLGEGCDSLEVTWMLVVAQLRFELSPNSKLPCCIIQCLRNLGTSLGTKKSGLQKMAK